MSPAALDRLMRAALERAGSGSEEASVVAEHLVGANLAGHDSHGLSMLPLYLGSIRRGALQLNRRPVPVAGSGAMIVFDGQRGFGHVAARRAIEAGMTVTREHGVALVGLRNSGHVGRVGTYGEIAAAAGFGAVIFVNAIGRPSTVAPHGGAEARFSSNPLCLAVPAGQGRMPVVLDIATAGIAIGKARMAWHRGETLPAGLLLDPQGRPTVDPRFAVETPLGSLLPFGGHKGSGLGLLCDLIAGALTGGGTAKPGHETDMAINNMIAILFDPAWLGARAEIESEIAAMIDYVRSAKPLDPACPVMTPGEIEAATRARRQREGIPIDDATWEQFEAAALAAGLTQSEINALV